MTRSPRVRAKSSGTRLSGAGGALVSFAAAVGLVVGVRSVVALELPRWRPLLGVTPLPRDPLGLTWSPRAVWPGEVQEMALERMAGLLAALLLAGASVALVNALVLLVEAGSARRRELAVRAAVGAGPGALLFLLLRQVRALLLSGLVLGLLLGMVVGGVLRGAWPGTVVPLGWSDALVTFLPPLALLVGFAALAYLWTGVSVGRRGALAVVLASGGRSTADRGEAFRRRFLSAFQMGMAGAVALAALALSLGGAGTEGASSRGEGTVVLAVDAPGTDAPDWHALLAGLEALEGMELAAVASPGALLGLGIRDNATAQCGNCYRGGLPLPLWGARADHHAVAPGFFQAVGTPLLAGRGLTREDGPGAPRVALVNRTFANAAFEKGDPLGRMVRLGRGLDDWYEVVGVVEDHEVVGVGGTDVAPSMVYVSALQHATHRVDVILRGTEDSVVAARASLGAAGLVETAPPRSLSQVTRDAGAPLVWAARLAMALALVAWFLAVFGAHATTLQVTRRRTPELAVRRVLGATRGRVVAHVLGGSVKTALWGAGVALFFGTLLVALLRKTVSVPSLGPSAYGAMAAVLVAAALLASVRAAREALAVAPAEVLE